MKAVESKFLNFLSNARQFVIPIYQRTYSWDEKQCQQLWDDILNAGRKKDFNTHFVGSIVYVKESMDTITVQSPFLVIDGQQRLTTVSLLLEALARRIGEKEIVDGFSENKLNHYYLINSAESGDRRYKLLLSQTDRDSLLALIDHRELPTEYSIRIKANFDFFDKKLEEMGDDLGIVCSGVSKLAIVDISLERGQDNPQLIFESLNSTGRELSQADLIRNFILMGLSPELQTDLYNQYWYPMEKDFGQEAYLEHFDSFMRHYLTVKTGEIPNIRDVYDTFKQYARGQKIVEGGVKSLVADIRSFADYYCAMALGKEEDRELKDAFHDIRELKVDVAYPFLLELYRDYTESVLSKEEFLKILRLMESYVFRRAICEIPTNSMNKTFARFSRSVKSEKYLESVQATFLLLPSYRRFPDDEEFKRWLQLKDLYNFRNRSYWLRRLENEGRNERVYVDDYTIEHIMPQNENLSDEWKKELGTEWERIHNEYLHRLGNLTLTGYNPSLSDRPFSEKKTITGGFANSPLRLNQGLAQMEKWDEQAIQNRSESLAKQIVGVWVSPVLDESVLAQYKPKRAAEETYTVEHFPHLGGEMKGLYEEFRKQVLAIDPCVTEEFLKHYVAYKAETNFVDLEPRATWLKLILNMKFADVNDPRGKCEDVSHIGRIGNGEVKVTFSKMEELPYIMTLVRQSYDRQMGGDGTD